jgi:hypothetical protein
MGEPDREGVAPYNYPRFYPRFDDYVAGGGDTASTGPGQRR